MLFGRIFCRYLKNVVVFEDGIKIGGKEGADLLSSDSFLKGEIHDDFEGGI